MTTLPDVPSISNFREMGGLPAAGGTVRSGALFRSAHLAEASDDDLAALAGLGIQTIVDFRTEVDLRGDGGRDRVPDGVNHLQLPMTDTSGHGAEIRTLLLSGDEALMAERYGEGRGHQIAADGVRMMALDEEKQEVYREFLSLVASAESRPVLWHCSAGKDRAGWAATLLGIALGVPDDALIAHYLESNVHRPFDERAATYAKLGLNIELMKPFMVVHEDYINTGLRAIDERWATREDYLAEALGFGPDKVEQLRADLIE